MKIHERIGNDYIYRLGTDGEADLCFDRGDTEEFIVFVTRGQADSGAQWKLMDSNSSTTYYTGEIQNRFVLQSHETSGAHIGTYTNNRSSRPLCFHF